MNGTPQVDEVARLRGIVAALDEAVARRSGELAAAVRDQIGACPIEVGAAFMRYEAAEQAAEVGWSKLNAARAAVLTPDERDARRYFSRISALIAVHFARLKIVKDGNDIHPWRVVEPNGRRRMVPNYATEIASVSTAEREMDATQAVRYGRYLADLFAGDLHRIATANPYARCCAMLYAAGIDPDSEPAVAE